MSVKIEYNNEKKALYVTLNGQVSIEEFSKTIIEVAENKNFSPDIRTLVDIRELDFSEINADFLKELISLEKKNTKRINTKVAYIANTDISFGMSRMYQTLSDELPKTSIIFRDYSEGERWLLNEI